MVQCQLKSKGRINKLAKERCLHCLQVKPTTTRVPSQKKKQLLEYGVLVARPRHQACAETGGTTRTRAAEDRVAAACRGG